MEGGAAGTGCEELSGTLQHLRDLTWLDKGLLPLQGVTLNNSIVRNVSHERCGVYFFLEFCLPILKVLCSLYKAILL